MSANEERLYTVQELVDAGIVGDPVNGGRGRLLEILGDDVVFDAISRPCVTESVAVRLAEKRKAEEAARAEDARRRAEAAAEKKTVPKGVPAQEGMSAHETMMAASDYALPSDEYGLPKPHFLEEELAAGRRAAAEKKAAADRMKKDLQ